MRFLLPFFVLISFLKAGIDTEIYARWLLNNGDLLVDKGKYLEAFDSYDSAKVASSSDIIKLDSYIREANVLSLYLYKQKEASKILYDAYRKYPDLDRSEYALFYSAMLVKDYDIDLAKNRFLEYLKRYPDGKFSFQAKFFIKKIGPIKKEHTKLQHFKKTPTVRVLLAKAKKVTFEGDLIINGNRYKNAKFYTKNNQIFFNSNFFDEVLIKSNSPIYFSNENKKYYGSIKLVSQKNRIYVINLVDITHYLYGVVTSESVSSWDIETLKAQAVASRSFVYYQMIVRKNWLYDVRDDTFDQVYKGISGTTKKSIQATKSTIGEVIIHNKRPILAQFCANTGWHTSSSKEIFGTDFEYLLAQKDPFSKKMPDGKWVKKISIFELENKLNKMGIEVKGIIDIKPAKITKSGRVVKVKIVAQNGSKIFKTYSSIRRAVKLKDILLSIERRGDYFIFNGGGYGHGVGYSQWGGQAMAKDGYGYREILSFYYPNTKIQKVW